MAAKRGECLRFIYGILAAEAIEECVKWPYSRDKDGYPDRVPFHNVRRRVCAVICELENGLKPTPQHEAAHTCGKGHEGCVNPKHLRWATHKENCSDKAIHGTVQRGERNAAAILNEDQVRQIMALKGTDTNRNIGALFGVSASTVQHILTGRKWAYLFRDRLLAEAPLTS